MNTRVMWLLTLLILVVGMWVFAPAAPQEVAFGTGGPDVPLPVRAEFEQAQKLTGKLEVGGHCSATKIGPHTLLTAGHCVVSNPDKLRFTGETMRVERITDDGSDHALVRVDATFESWAEFGPSPKVGDKIYVFGNPADYTQLLRLGYVAGSKEQFVLYDLNGYWGDSGSAVFNEQGQVVGMQIQIRNDSRMLGDSMASMKFMASLPFAFTPKQLEEARK